MSVCICLKDVEFGNEMKESINKVLPDMKIDIFENFVDLYIVEGFYDYAFIGEAGAGFPLSKITDRLLSKETEVYFLFDYLNEYTQRLVKELHAKKAILLDNVTDEVEKLFTKLSETNEVKNSGDASIGDPEALFSKSIKNDVLRDLKKEQYPAEIISFLGARGGSGKTIIASNVAVALANMGLKVIVVDFDIENGNMLNVFSIESEMNLKSVCKGNYKLQEDYFSKHSSGVSLLPSFANPGEFELITEIVAERLKGRIARVWDVIIVDSGVYLTEPILLSAEISDKAYFVTNYDFSSLAANNRMYLNLKNHISEKEKFKIALNRLPAKLTVDEQYLSENFSLDVIAKISEEPKLLKAINQGEIPYETGKYKKFNKEIDAIAKDIVSEPRLKDRLEVIKSEKAAAKKKKSKK